jgi:hypothetical protein
MSEDDAAPTEPDAEKEETPGWKTCCLWPALAVLALSIGGAIVGALGASGEDDSGPSAEMASYHCRDMVREQLKSPSTAEFSDETITGHGTYTIEGTVRGENSFGGTAVNTYECTATYDERDDGYMVRVRIY